MYETGRLLLEAVTDEAVAEIFKFYNSYNMVKGIESSANFICPTTLEQLKEGLKGDGPQFIIKEKTIGEEKDIVIGYASISTNWVTRVSGPFLFIGEKWHNKGYGKELLDCLLRIMFYEINARKCSITVYSFNGPAIHVYRGAGLGKKED